MAGTPEEDKAPPGSLIAAWDASFSACAFALLWSAFAYHVWSACARETPCYIDAYLIPCAARNRGYPRLDDAGSRVHIALQGRRVILGRHFCVCFGRGTESVVPECVPGSLRERVSYYAYGRVGK